MKALKWTVEFMMGAAVFMFTGGLIGGFAGLETGERMPQSIFLLVAGYTVGRISWWVYTKLEETE